MDDYFIIAATFFFVGTAFGYFVVAKSAIRASYYEGCLSGYRAARRKSMIDPS